MDTTATIHGSEALQRKLQQLPRRVRSSVTRKAIAAGSTIVLRSARSGAPRRSGTLARSMGRRGKTTKSGYMMKIGSRTGFQTTFNGKPYNPTRVAHLVEKGTKPHQVVSRRHPGAKAHPFIKPSLDDNLSEVKNTISSKMWSEIVKEAQAS